MDEDVGVVAADHEDETRTDAVSPDNAAHDLQRVRDLILQAHPDVVPELIGGTTIDELLASVTPARDAFTRVSERMATTQTQARIPAGGPVRTATINAEHLSPVSKIRMGLGRDG